MNFVPEQPKKSQDVPYFDDVSASEGWQGHATNKSEARLRQEISEAVERLGGEQVSYQAGRFVTGKRERDGFRIRYMLTESNTVGAIDIAALPVKVTSRNKGSEKSRRQKSLKMALYMLRNALDGLWFLQQLSPGYAPLMPWMLVDGERTVTQLWSESGTMRNLLPPGESEFVVEGNYREV